MMQTENSFIPLNIINIHKVNNSYSKYCIVKKGLVII